MKTPDISIILPTFNREKFLPSAIAAIRDQQFTNWELIIVDDGSTDNTAELVQELTAKIPQQVKYIYQSNQGAYIARNTGLENVSGRYVAFYDSDDLWLSHHLQRCVESLEQNPDIGWVYAATEMVDHSTGRIVNENSFQVGGERRAFRSLAYESRGDLHVLKEEGLFDAVLGGVGLYCGLQNSVIVSSFFDQRPFVTDFHNEAEDQVVVLRAIAAGVKFAYLTDVHVRYHIHDQNSSAAALSMPQEKRLRLAEGLIEGFQKLPDQIPMTRSQKTILRRRIAELTMWQLGYHSYWMFGSTRDALNAYRKAIALNPIRLAFWKTYFLAKFKTAFRPSQMPVESRVH